MPKTKRFAFLSQASRRVSWGSRCPRANVALRKPALSCASPAGPVEVNGGVFVAVGLAGR